MATKKKHDKTERIPVMVETREVQEPLRTFGYILSNGEKGEIKAHGVIEAQMLVKDIAESFGILDKKGFYDFFEVNTP